MANRSSFPVFHGEYWVYILAGVGILVVGTLLYTLDAPINFAGWFL